MKTGEEIPRNIIIGFCAIILVSKLLSIWANRRLEE